MKPNLKHLLTIGAGLLLVPLYSSLAQSAWQTVDAITPWQGRAVVADSGGNFISLAISTNSTTTAVSTLVSRSTDAGVTWQSVGLIGGYALKLAAAPDGTLYASGNRSATVSGKAFIWVSLDHGATWNFATDPWADQTQTNALLSLDIRTDSTGALYLAGDILQGNHWVVRKGQPTANGLIWSTVDNFPSSSGNPIGVHVRPAATAGMPDEVFVCGNANGSWTLRHSLDAGVTWATIDSYTFGLSDSVVPAAFSLATGPDGSIYVAGRVGQSITTTTVTTNTVHHKVVVSTNSTTSTQYGGLVRKSANGGASWSNVDYVTNGWPAYARGVVVDASGRICVAGSLSATTGTWLVRASTDGGATWFTTDAFLPSGYTSAQATSAASDVLGNICVLGDLVDGNGSDDFAITRRLAAQ
jgi:hypothetical protein